MNIYYNIGIVFIPFVGTHAEYDKIDASNHLSTMKAKILKTEVDYQAALARVESLMDAKPGSAKEEELQLWSLLVERYEQEHFPIVLPDPMEAIKFRMEQEGPRQKDLAKVFPGKNSVPEVLHRRRPLSLGMISSLHKHQKHHTRKSSPAH